MSIQTTQKQNNRHSRMMIGMTIFNDSTDEDTNTDNIIEDEDIDTPFTFSEIKHKTIIDNQFG